MNNFVLTVIDLQEKQIRDFVRNNLLAPVVRRLDNAFHRINHYPLGRMVCFVNTYSLDSELSGE